MEKLCAPYVPTREAKANFNMFNGNVRATRSHIHGRKQMSISGVGSEQLQRGKDFSKRTQPKWSRKRIVIW